eukprot:2737613-Prymnesium_polylepis.2
MGEQCGHCGGTRRDIALSIRARLTPAAAAGRLVADGLLAAGPLGARVEGARDVTNGDGRAEGAQWDVVMAL